MSVWIKICGNTSREDALLAADAGADAVGFVFAPSPRRVTPEQVAEIVPHLPTTLETIGVFVDASFEEIESTVLTSGLTGVQLHFIAAPDLPARLRERFGPTLRILRVLHFSSEAAGAAAAIMHDPNVDTLMIDSRTASAVGGTGQSFDWALARNTLFENALARELRLVVAGGLNPDNIAEAIASLHPWGVDVVSGVEAAPGRKDRAKVRSFIANAKTAHCEKRP
jgi:phosphoribosylanthranilate isomerase